MRYIKQLIHCSDFYKIEQLKAGKYIYRLFFCTVIRGIAFARLAG